MQALPLWQSIYNAFKETANLPASVSAICDRYVLESAEKCITLPINLHFQRVHGKNFASYPEIEFAMNGKGLVGIFGKVGSGKSALVELIHWIAYGKTSFGAIAKDLVTEGKQEVIGSLWFANEGVPYKIERKWAKGNNYLALDIGGTPVKSESATKMQGAVNEALGMSEQEFQQTCFFTPGNYFANANDVEMKRILEAVSDGPIFSTAYENYASFCKKEATANKLQEVQVKLQMVQSEIAGYAKSIEYAKVHRENSIANLQTKKQHLLAEKESLSLQKIELQNKLHATQDAIVDEPLDLHELRSSFAYLGKEIAAISERQIQVRSFCTSVSARVDILGKLQQKVCPTCEQPAEFTPGQSMEYDVLRRQLADAKVGLETLVKQYALKQTEYAELNEQLQSALSAKNSKSNEKSKISMDLQYAERKFVDVSEHIKSIESDLREMQAHEIDSSAKLDDLNEMQSELNAKVADLQNKRAIELEVLQALGPAGLISLATDAIVKKYNEILGETVELLQVGFQVALNSTKSYKTNDKKDAKITVAITPNRLRSNGQRGKIALAMQIALAKLRQLQRGYVSLAVLDEVDCYFDDESAMTLANYLKHQPQLALYVSHKPDAIREYCGKAIEVMLNGGKSELEVVAWDS